MKTGSLQRTHLAITSNATNDAAEFTLVGGLGHVPITFSGLTSHQGYILLIDGQQMSQRIHGRRHRKKSFGDLRS